MRPRLTEFVSDDGVVHELRGPDEPATSRQLAWLNRHGMLDVVTHPVEPLSKGQAAWLIDETRRRAGE